MQIDTELFISQFKWKWYTKLLFIEIKMFISCYLGLLGYQWNHSIKLIFKNSLQTEFWKHPDINIEEIWILNTSEYNFPSLDEHADINWETVCFHTDECLFILTLLFIFNVIKPCLQLWNSKFYYPFDLAIKIVILSNNEEHECDSNVEANKSL